MHKSNLVRSGLVHISLLLGNRLCGTFNFRGVVLSCRLDLLGLKDETKG